MGGMVWSEVLDNLVAGASISREMLKAGEVDGPRAMDTLSVPTLLSWAPGSIEAEWEIQPSLLNSRGELFGGYYGVLADVAASYTGLTVTANKQFLKTLDLRVSYFRPAIEGKIRIEGSVTNQSKSFVHTETVFFNDDGKMLSKAVATFAVSDQ
jgi:uncharacterized protein (TIGR00369 family)